MAEFSPKQFQEIGHAGGKLVIKYHADTHRVSSQYSHSGPLGCAVIQMGVSLDGKELEFWPIHGMGRAPEPSPMVSALLISDNEQMWGRTCPQCRSYFRTNQAGKMTFCPYCGIAGRHDEFTTANQRTFIDHIRQAYLTAWSERHDVMLDIDKVADQLPENRPAWAYNEERQQNRYACNRKSCGASYDVLGRYAGCPSCGHRNSLHVFSEEVRSLRAKVVATQQPIVSHELFVRGLSEFEAMAKDLQNQLARLPCTPKRRKEIKRLNFQRFAEAVQALDAWFGIDLLADMSSQDHQFISLMLARRHLFTHNGGRVDQKYLDETTDKSVRLHQQVEVRADDTDRLLALLLKSATNLCSGYESITGG